MSKKIAIVTGVTGQMGSYMCDFLLNEGLRVIGTVRRLSVKNHRNIDHINNKNFSLDSMDLGDPHSINSLIEKYKPDFFVNCAANSFVGSSWDFPEQHFDYNALGVLRQLEAIRRFSLGTRYLNFGSSEEFGDVQYCPQDDKHPARARSPYGASKIAARQIVKVYRESYGLYAIQCWCFNYESPRRGEEFVTRKITKGVARIAKALKQGIDFDPIFLGNLDAMRDWSHAGDFVDGIWKMLNQPTWETGNNGIRGLLLTPKEYVLASGETHTIREFIELAFTHAGINGAWWDGITGKPEDEEFLLTDGKTFTKKRVALVKVDPKFYRPAEVEQLLGDPTRAKLELGWEPKVSFQDLVNEMVDYDLKEVGI